MMRSMEHHGRCGGHGSGGHDPGGHGRSPGGHGPGGHGGHGRGPWSQARRGNVRVAILSALAEQPMHGYQIMQHLESRSAGMWRPSPGSVYPTLQLLEDQGFVKSEEIQGRRVFSLTEDGKSEAQQSKERFGTPWEDAEHGEQSSRFKLRRAVFQIGAATKQVGTTGSAEQVERTLEILAAARKSIYELLAAGD
jgi:DNA-binding PadR family transcriptional regulator